jgi:hypothetical protein
MESSRRRWHYPAAIEGGDPLEDWRDIRLPPGKAAALIDSDRSEQ